MAQSDDGHECSVIKSCEKRRFGTAEHLTERQEHELAEWQGGVWSVGHKIKFPHDLTAAISARSRRKSFAMIAGLLLIAVLATSARQILAHKVLLRTFRSTHSPIEL